MLSGKLIHLIESHWDTITARVLEQIQQDPELTHIRGLARAELRGWAQDVLENLGHWLSHPGGQEIGERYEALGRLRYEESVPLAEAVRGLTLLKASTVDFIQSEGLHKTALELYAEEELEIRVGRFFDSLLFHMVRGYERALRQTLHLAAHA